MSTTGYTWDPRFLLHDTGVDEVRLPSGELLDPEPHPSNLRIARRTAQLVGNSGLLGHLEELPARSASLDELTLVHEAGYVEDVQRITEEGGGMLHRNTPITRGSWDAALLAAGSSVGLTQAVMSGRVTRAFGLVRPPGHHASAASTMGYCVFNNAAIAARHARVVEGADRVAIIDWEVQHGNGTQSVFLDDPSVLFVSVHQDNWFPAGTGKVDEVGIGAGEGTTVNVPLPPGTGDRGYDCAFERIVEPVTRQFRPDLIVLSAGQAASLLDPLGRMLVTSQGFRGLAGQVKDIADDVCEGRLVALNEGGYSPGYTPFCTLAVIEGIAGQRSDVTDPLSGESELAQAMVELRTEQEEAVERAQAVQSHYWRFAEDGTAA